MSKKEALAIHKKLHALSVQHLRKLKALPLQALQGELALIPQILGDLLYAQTGIESDELDNASDRLGLEDDTEYQMMVNEYKEQVGNLRLGQP